MELEMEKEKNMKIVKLYLKENMKMGKEKIKIISVLFIKY